MISQMPAPEDPFEGLDEHERQLVAAFLSELREQARREPVPPVGPELASLMREGGHARRVRLGAWVAAMAAAMALVVAGWAGANGELPKPVQQLVASVGRAVGVDLPESQPHRAPVRSTRAPAAVPGGTRPDTVAPTGTGGTPGAPVGPKPTQPSRPAPGKSRSAPGQSGSAPGQSGSAPGKGK